MSEPGDTSPAAERKLIELYRGMDLAQKWKLLFEHLSSVEAFARAGILQRHPGADERELTLRLAALRYPRELMIKVFGWDPEEKGH